MSTILTRKGADYSLNARVLVPPVTAGLLGWWYLGALAGDDAPTAQARTLKNLAGTPYVMTMNGTPTLATGYAQVDGTNYLSTNIPETLDFTLLALALPVAISGSFGGWLGTSTDKTLFGPFTTLTSVAAYTPRDIGGGTHNQVGVPALALGAGWTTLRVLSYKITSATGVCFTRDLTGGTSSTLTISGGVRAICNGAPTLRLGGMTGLTGAVRLGFAAAYNRALTDAEGDSIRQFVAKYRLAKYGDVV